jgi:hypothetical protein
VFHHQEHRFRAFLQQMMVYGQSQARVWKRFGEVRRFAPLMALFWLGVLVGWTSIFVSTYLFWAYCAIVISYFAIVAVSAVSVAIRMRSAAGLAALALYPTQHAAYAWGFVRGLLRS